jgi:hypothetical protein
MGDLTFLRCRVPLARKSWHPGPERVDRQERRREGALLVDDPLRRPAPKGEKRPVDANRNNLRNLSRLRNINSFDVPIYRFSQ